MRKNRLALLLTAAAVLIGLLVFQTLRDHEPSYHGRSLSSWVRGLASPDRGRFAESEEAVRHIGTNAIPYLLEWIRYDPSSSETRRLRRINGFLGKINRNWGLSDREWIRAEGAAVALSRLRPQADAYIPELARIMNDPQAFSGVQHAIEALTGFEDSGLPPLLATLTNGPPEWRYFILSRIRRMGTNARPAIPALRLLLKDDDSHIRFWATNTIRKIAPEALGNPVAVE